MTNAAVAAAELQGVARVIDGDTLQVGETLVRIFGIDAPETDQTCKRPDGQTWACGVWVSHQVRRLLKGQNVSCDAIGRDRYDRVVAQCNIAEADIGRTLVQRGLAFAYLRYSDAYSRDEREARAGAIGLHRSIVQSPAAFRQGRKNASVQTAPEVSCTIKGNISSDGERIYHSPGQRDYVRTRIDTAKGEQWFCTHAQAQAAGWRAARR
ncbi:MAG: thermonuclease family protein [Pseudomonadota bacterium]